eukprot:CAMPEP_0206388704 /NCGR_PEP_ID=MMETSP0294-20121207/17456_1 /ASSEMBLY_ACC=CAM_ASM_000327 /TAXON_ID=39354 /ORGANISM="Heterosigma akashiwo, Strain CCMP2393" /LENGTH=355 /DNA_ID=CAMNT_0053840511 /DNA_START=125 /DNA_END=1189 /DNA_ORIENTATION=+
MDRGDPQQNQQNEFQSGNVNMNEIFGFGDDFGSQLAQSKQEESPSEGSMKGIDQNMFSEPLNMEQIQSNSQKIDNILPDGGSNKSDGVGGVDLKNEDDKSDDAQDKKGKAPNVPASQRITLHDLEKYYHCPLIEVAKVFNISTTILKRICRKFGIQRWPHRQIRSINSTIEQLKEQAALLDPPQSLELLQQVDLLEKKKKLVTRTSSCGLNATLRNAIFMARPGEVDEDVLFSKDLLPNLRAAISSEKPKKKEDEEPGIATTVGVAPPLPPGYAPAPGGMGVGAAVGMGGFGAAAVAAADPAAKRLKPDPGALGAADPLLQMLIQTPNLGGATAGGAAVAGGGGAGGGGAPPPGG